MKDFFTRLQYRMAEAMQGRQGPDAMANFFVVVGIAALVIAFISGIGLFSWLALACYLYAFFRCFSKNHSKRNAENEQFLKMTEKPRHWGNMTYKKIKNRKTTKYFKCPECGQSLSVPRGKGTLRVVCPKCKTEAIKKT